MAATQVNTNQIKDGAITNAKVNAAAAIATSKLADAANFILRTGAVPFTADQSFGGFKATNVANGTNPGDAVNRAQLDAAQSGLNDKGAVRAATTVAGTLATDFENGDVIDGVTLATGNRILIKNQASGIENGFYIVQASGAPVRAPNSDTGSSAVNIYSFVSEGTVNADTGWHCINDAGSAIVGTDALSFTQFNGTGTITAGAGLTKTGNTIDVEADDDSILVSPDGISVQIEDASLETVSGGIRVKQGTPGQVYIANAGNVATPQTVTGDVTFSGSGVSTLRRIVRETPTGAINGSNTAFTLANTPKVGSEEVYLNGILQEPGAGNDYTISGGTITYLTAPETGDRLRVSYLY